MYNQKNCTARRGRGEEAVCHTDTALGSRDSLSIDWEVQHLPTRNMSGSTQHDQ